MTLRTHRRRTMARRSMERVEPLEHRLVLSATGSIAMTDESLWNDESRAVDHVTRNDHGVAEPTDSWNDNVDMIFATSISVLLNEVSEPGAKGH